MLRIGEAARELGVSRDTLRRFEARGLIEPVRDWVGQRRYNRERLAALRGRIFRDHPGSNSAVVDAGPS